MQAEIITIGDEILIGQILDSNSKWMAEELNNIGISIYQIVSIQDDKDHIMKALKDAHANCDIVIITGGLGPTKDDITKLALTKYFDDEMVLNNEIAEEIKKRFKKINYPFTEVNKNQALLPTKCIPLYNNWGTAPGMWFDLNGKLTISLPGVPNEMKGLMRETVLPKLQKTFKLPFILHKTIITYGMGESMVAERIESWENELPKLIRLAYLPSYGKLRLRLTAKGTNLEELEKCMEAEVEKVGNIIPDIIVGFDEEKTMEAVVGELLRQNNLTLGIAESCTGGNIAKMITAVPGASEYFIGSIVAYNRSVKTAELKVSSELIDQFSVVSAQVAEAMAKGIRKKFKTNYAIATTGNAGPTSDITDSSVGVVFIAIAGPSILFSKEFNFGKPREKVIERASNKALELLRKEILKKY
jgi:nicotinamide-nucleotide amidase